MGRFIKLFGVVFTGLFIIVISNVSAQDKSKVEKAGVINATIFKNGTALIRQEIKGMVDDKGWIRFSNIAPPILGTLNVISEGTDQVILEDIDNEEPITALADLFEANIGKTIMMSELNKDGVKTYRAEKIIAVLKKDEQMANQPQPPRYDGYYPTPIETKLVVLESDLGTRIVSVNNFSEFMGQNGQNILMTKKSKKPQLAIHMTNSRARETTVVVEYLTRGLRWIPAYRIDLTTKDKADISLSAEVVNDLIDLDQTRIEFAGGFPHFLFDGQLSPVSLVPFWPTFSQFISTRGLQKAAGANMAAQQSAGYLDERESLDRVGAVSNIQPMAGITTAEGGDLHFYQLPALSLPKGKRGKFVLWQTNAPYEHCYTLEIDEAKKKDEERLRRERYGYYNNNQPGITSEELTEKVGRAWHVLNLKNTGNLPWTMGPAACFESGRPLGQDILYFTAPGTETPFYMAPAPHITYRYEEEVIGRGDNARMYQGYRYDLIKERGTLKIANNKAEPIKLKLTFHRGGEITTVDNKNLTITKMAFEQTDWGVNWGNYEINAHSKFTGELNLKAGEEITIILERQYYQRG